MAFQGTQSSSLRVPGLSPPPNNPPTIHGKSFSGETLCRLAKQWPVRLAHQLEAQPGQSTILSNVSRQPEHLTQRDAKCEALVPYFRARFASSPETCQEKLTTTWQKN